MERPINKFIDHTLLKPDATRAQVEKVCVEGVQYQFASVCVNTCWTKLAYELLQKSGVNVCVTVGFPLGATTTLVKVFEADQAIDAGAAEVDMVINAGALKSGLHEFVHDDIAGVVKTCHRVKQAGALLKVIIETALLTDGEKRLACEIAKDAGADFVKTSTGFNGGGATVEDIRLMRAVVGPGMGVKASGGVRTYEQAMAMIEAGATRIGTSNGVAIMQGVKAADAAQSDY
jgi:deoxyribose-phosphate aldolase